MGELTREIETDPEKYSAWLVGSLCAKADKNKSRARWTATLGPLLGSGVAVILLFQDFSWWSVVASVMSLANGSLIAWLQIEKPHERWRVYRKYHRAAEAERIRFLNSLAPYNGTDREKVFFEHLARLQTSLHEEWDGLMPQTSEVVKIQGKT